MGRLFGIFKLAGNESIEEDITLLKIYEHLIDREGIRHVVYKDSLGKPTAGVGHLIVPDDAVSVGDKIGTDRILQWLEKDTDKAYKAAIKQAKEIGVETEHFIIALTSVNFQLGTGWTKKFRTSYPNLVKGDYRKAIVGFRGSLWNRQTPKRVADFIEAIELAFKT